MQAPSSLIGPDAIRSLCDIAAARPPGCFVEFGVYKGGSAWHLAQVAQEQGRELHLYDTFKGIPHRKDCDKHQVGDFADTDLQAVRAAVPSAHIHVGLFPATLAPMPPVAFAHVDADQYQSIKDAIDFLGPLMVSGAVMVFDDVPILAGATQALNDSGLAYEFTAAGKAMVRFP